MNPHAFQHNNNAHLDEELARHELVKLLREIQEHQLIHGVGGGYAAYSSPGSSPRTPPAGAVFFLCFLGVVAGYYFVYKRGGTSSCPKTRTASKEEIRAKRAKALRKLPLSKSNITNKQSTAPKELLSDCEARSPGGLNMTPDMVSDTRRRWKRELAAKRFGSGSAAGVQRPSAPADAGIKITVAKASTTEPKEKKPKKAKKKLRLPQPARFLPRIAQDEPASAVAMQICQPVSSTAAPPAVRSGGPTATTVNGSTAPSSMRDQLFNRLLDTLVEDDEAQPRTITAENSGRNNNSDHIIRQKQRLVRFLTSLSPQEQRCVATILPGSRGVGSSAAGGNVLTDEKGVQDFLEQLRMAKARKDVAEIMASEAYVNESVAKVVDDDLTKFFHVPYLPSSNHTAFLLQRLAREFLPIAAKRGFRVLLVSEMCCCSDGFKAASGEARNPNRIKTVTASGSEDQCGGYNRTFRTSVNQTSHTIFIRLRDRINHYKFRDYDQVATTMAHELAHCMHQNHSPQFYKLMKDIQEEHRQLTSFGAPNGATSEEQFGFDIYGSSTSRTRF